jgi:serine protease Do
MLRLFIFVSIIFTANFSYSFEQQKLMKAWASSVMIRGYTDNGLAYGSGVVVGENQVVTNCHVLRKTKSPWVSWGDSSYSVIGVKADPWHDLCVLSVHNLNVSPVPLGSSKDLKKGQEIVGIGHSNGAPKPLTTGGYIIATYEFDKENIILSSAKFRMGASGSGLFDLEGRLIGINTFKTTGYGNYYSMPADWIKSVMKQEMKTKFPIKGKALWEEAEEKKPYFLKIAIPKTKKNWKKLLEVTKSWTEKETLNTEAWYELGFANEKLEKNNAAMVAYEESIRLDKNNSDALYRLALMLKINGDLKKVNEIQKILNVIDVNKAYELKNHKT